MNDARAGGRSGRYYVQILKRRAWIVVLAAPLGLAAGLLYSKHESPLYRAQSSIVVNTPTLLASTNQSSNGKTDQARFNATEATVAASSAVAGQAVKIARVPGWTAQELLGRSAVVANPDSNVVQITVDAQKAKAAVALANAYAVAATNANRALAIQQINKQLVPLNAQSKLLQADITHVQAQINQSHTQDPSASTSAEDALLRTYSDRLDSLLKTKQTLQNEAALIPTSASVAQTAAGAAQILPDTKRNVLAGLGAGIVIGLGLAFLLEAMDGRMRSAEAVTDELGLPLLARIPAPTGVFESGTQVEMLTETSGAHREAYRKLRVSLDLANVDRRARTIMISSALDQEGKTTTVANLAAALAQVGRKVTLVDLDLRRPNLGRQFGLSQVPGVTDVALGDVSLIEATHSVAIAAPVAGARGAAAVNGNGHGVRPEIAGVLNIITAGTQVHDPGAFLESDALSRLLAEISEQSDIVLVDAPPTLPVSDALTIATKTDAVVLLARLGTVRRAALRELRRELQGTGAWVLGVVVTAAETDDGYGYGYGYGYRSPYLSPASRVKVG